MFLPTHYVSAIELGASEYRVLSETEYFSRIKAGGSFGVEALANLAISSSASWKKTKKASDLKRIGRIVNELMVVLSTFLMNSLQTDTQQLGSSFTVFKLKLQLTGQCDNSFFTVIGASLSEPQT